MRIVPVSVLRAGESGEIVGFDDLAATMLMSYGFQRGAIVRMERAAASGKDHAVMVAGQPYGLCGRLARGILVRLVQR
ncbi:MAG: FeoA domain-containing protein [Thermodesulfobacteriota bacterium]